MKKIKSPSALLIVFFAQANIFTHNYLSLQNISETELEKNSKKIIASIHPKQGISRMVANVKLTIKRFLLKNPVQNHGFFFQIFNFLKKCEEILTKNGYSKIRILWFGCCIMATK